ncbi:MAG: BamA/TamA family outer membrane protein [Niabella sp.]
MFNILIKRNWIGTSIIMATFFFPLIVAAQQDTLKYRKAEFKVAPYFSYSNTIGFGFGLIPMLSFYPSKKDSISPKSYVGISGFYTTNKSRALVGFANLFLDEDKWRLSVAGGISVYNFQTYFEPAEGEGLFVDYGTNSNFIAAIVKRRVARSIFLGLGYIYQKSVTDFNNLRPEDNTTLNTLQYQIIQDKRDFVNYPRKGSMTQITFRNIPKWLGNEEPSNVIVANYNRYIGVKEMRDVVALRFHVKAGLDDVSFQQQPVLGGVDLRGYSNGKYRGDGVMDIQGEYRWNFKNKIDMSVVGFAGLGTLYGSSTSSFNWKMYPSIGAGIRYTALKSNHLNIGLDVGVGKKDWGLYFRFNEAF